MWRSTRCILLRHYVKRSVWQPRRPIRSSRSSSITYNRCCRRLPVYCVLVICLCTIVHHLIAAQRNCLRSMLRMFPGWTTFCLSAFPGLANQEHREKFLVGWSGYRSARVGVQSRHWTEIHPGCCLWADCTRSPLTECSWLMM